MSVVFHRSAGKMILKSYLAAIVLSLAWIKSVAGATSYSNVYMQSGPSLAAFYGPAALRSAQLAPLAAAPLMSSLLPPCVSPCVIPSQQVAALTPVATSSANFVSYKSPISVPVVVAPTNNDGTNYEYSYVVYDEDTGDQKAQKESSDGSVVRGQYSLIQPDGYVREVQYTADDIRGFNAVVKNFLPESEAKNIQPCPDTKNEPLQESPKDESHEKANEAHDLEPEAHGEAHEDSHEGQSHEEHAEHVEPAKPEAREEQASHEEHGEHKQSESPESHEERGGHEEHAEPDGHVELAAQEPAGREEHALEEPAAPESHEEPHSAEEQGSAEKKEEEPRAAKSAEILPKEVNALVSYNDIIKCIQSAIKGTPQPAGSPLTYIILNKPC